MTTSPAPAPARPSAPAPGAAAAVAGVLFGLAVVLGVVAVVYLVLELSGAPGSTVVCGNRDTSMGECLLALQVSRSQAMQTWSISLSLVAGSMASAGSGAVALLVLRRR
ncbi:hypothetical protein ASC77_06160 [Nocardioides sp. Root1257]|uniref:hypothetical protein n=1 Tax=unclassified Nocardioides TaxID=2615069 RepID=UPI0006F6A345|nr:MULTISPECIES: hypothetical protein [unclassified Nocardioides]KQW48344.1 hypothetical protein ASC77_06160 [Nocardioides sp. Root1257]KRC47518.1 hypothetical protein ASE24_06160 [Nocardioides sp. Root224]